jgi:uncharacterized protein (DUF305 family)
MSRFLHCVLTGCAGLALACAGARPPVAGHASSLPTPATVPDVAFMQGMIGHHAQAIAMTRLVAARTAASDLRALAGRIDASQREEIALIARWLRARGHAVPDTAHVMMGHQAAGDSLVPGMLTAAQLRELEASRGAEFDRRFLKAMIAHHEGALTMVQRLLAAAGERDPEVYRFAADVDADQRAEIARMRRLLVARGGR